MKVPAPLQSGLWLLLLLVAAWALRAPFLGRDIWNVDEGATFTMAQQVLQGDVLYRDAADHRSPLVPYLLAGVFAVAGDWNLYAQHFALAMAMGFCAFGLVALCSQLDNRAMGRWSAIAFTLIIFLLPGPLDALGVHTESFIIFFSTVGFWLFARALPRGGFLAGLPVGLAFGAGTLCKQPGLLDFGVTWVILGLLAWKQPPDRQRFGRLFLGALAGFAALFALACLYFWWNGVWRDFVYYCWTYNTTLYVPEVPLLERLSMIRLAWDYPWSNVSLALFLAIPAILLALWHVLPSLVRGNRTIPVLPLIILGWLATGLLSLTLSGRNFAHYTIQLAPGLSLACGWTIAQLSAWLGRTNVRRTASGWIGSALVLWVAHDVYQFRNHLDPKNNESDAPLRAIVQQYTTPSDRIFIWGYFPDGYVICQRLPATRFLYTNFLTGLIPWTNVDPELDTSYAVVPGAWDDFWADYEAAPPRVIVNSSSRNYSKYPLLSQPRLRDEAIDRFAEIQPRETSAGGVQILYRLSEPDAALGSVTPAIDESIKLEVARDPLQKDLVLVTASAPAGTTDITLRLGRRPHRHLETKGDKPVEARFTVRIQDLGSRWAGLIDVIVQRDKTVSVSKRIDIIRQLALDVQSVEPTPVLAYGATSIAPTSLSDGAKWQPVSIANQAGWRHSGPFELSFTRPKGMQVLSLAWEHVSGSSLQPGQPTAAQKNPPEILFAPTGEAAKPVPLELSPVDDRVSRIQANLPGGDGQFIVRWSGTDAAWLGALTGFGVGPPLRFGEELIQPSFALQNDELPLTSNPDGSWNTPAGSRLVYPRENGMEGVVLTFGAPTSGSSLQQAKGTAPVKLEVTFLHDDGRKENLMSRDVEAAGNHTAEVTLPNHGIGEIEVRFLTAQPVSSTITPYLFSPRVRGSGPDLVLSPDRILVPIESQTLGGDRIHVYTGEAWFAHAPSRVVYDCPADLRAITFGFELPKSGYLGEDGTVRSDGVSAIVEFDDGSSNVTQLYHRHIDPAAVPTDRGRIKARVELPGRRGRLIIRLTPGPQNSASFDWSYLMPITGEVAPINPAP
jgi:hypothetical protein